MTGESLTNRVPVAAAIQRERNPATPPERKCPECGERPPAGMVRHRECRGQSWTS